MTEESLIAAARDIPDPADRAAFLDHACGADADLRRRVGAVLGYAARADDPSHRTGGDGIGPTDDGIPGRYVDAAALGGPAPTGSRVGPYRLLQVLGEGGMGTVYLAEQSEPVERRVALKLIKADLGSDRLLARFEAERQALALMDHPNIAKVLDAGAAEGGRPFFVMELVKGVPITKFADGQHLTTRERIELFIPVCQAVQHAHQKGIIHRDIKPSNVLVGLYDGRPVPKVIDFGVAKATAQKLTDRTLFTEVGQIVGTLEYMAPEQAELNNLDIDTRADVYSLGVLLYELLTGSTPFPAKQLRGAAFGEMLRIIREVEPPKPSTKISGSEDLPRIAADRKAEPARLTRMVRGDLDWIAMRCLEKDRGRRYETANGLAADLGRYLADEPVLAGPPGASYRLGKFVKRHRVPVVAAGLVLLALVGGVAGTTTGLILADRAREAESERAEGERRAKHEALEAKRAAEESQKVALEQSALAGVNFDKARQAVDKYLTQVSENRLLKTPLPGMQPLRKELLTTALEYYRGFAEQHAADPKLQAELAAAYFRMGKITRLTGTPEQALRPLEKALAIYERLERDHPSDVAVQRGRADTESELARSLADGKRTSEAMRFFGRAEMRGEKFVRDHPGDAAARYELAANLNEKAYLEAGLGKTTEALRSYGRASSICGSLVEDHPRDPKYRVLLAGIRSNIGDCRLYSIHEPAEALKDYLEAVAIQDKLPAADAEDVKALEFLSVHYNGIANCYFYLKDRKKSLDANERSTEISDRLARENPRVTVFQSKLAMALVNLGQSFEANGRTEDGRNAFRRAIQIGERGASAAPDDPSFAFAIAQAYGFRGQGFLRVSKLPEAEADLEQAAASMKRAIEIAPHNLQYRLYIGNYYLSRGFAQWQLGQKGNARETWKRGPDCVCDVCTMCAHGLKFNEIIDALS